MSTEEPFLRRWSRRKRKAAAERAFRALRSADENESEKPGKAPEAAVVTHPVPLPSIESIDATSDMAAFLSPGVPADLTQAALRRAWVADPAIRDFIGLSENSWDFNAAGGVAGFGSLELADVRRLVTQVLPEDGVSEAAADTPSSPVAAPQLMQDLTAAEAAPSSDLAPVPIDAPAKDANDNPKSRNTRTSRRRGGALPL